MFDRRILILESSELEGGQLQRVSALRSLPFLVFLGEPGIGKSTLMDAEAAIDGVSPVTVRELVNGVAPPAGGPAYIDGLDEYRMSGDPADKAYELAAAIARLKTTRWRLACRAEDWRKEADIRAIQRATGASPTVVQLLPLDEDETKRILAILGEADPAGFVNQARRRGAAALLESPLSLVLLHKTVSSGEGWPGTRFDLFEQATWLLAHEHNDEHKTRRDRAAAEGIREAAARSSLLLLTTGAGAIWRSAGPTPDGVDARAFLTGDALGLDGALVGDMLDTPLFAGEGEQFEPMHRSIAEFLAGRALAAAVTGAAGGAAFPLNRALALITGIDGKPPTELRGLYAWFAAHLARSDETAKAGELVDNDPVSVLAYGDAAAFDLATRKRLLAALDRDDPYFLGSTEGQTVLGTLAQDDLADEFLEILKQPAYSHRLAATYQVLEHGKPLERVRPALRAIALDPKREEWQRRAAISAWVAGADDPAAARRELFEALSAEAVSVVRESFRAQLLAELPARLVSDDEIKDVVSSFAGAKRDSTVLRLFSLQRRLAVEPRASLLDAPLSWLGSSDLLDRTDIEHFFDALLSSAVKQTSDLDGRRLWRWTVHVRPSPYDDLGDKTSAAIRDWLEAEPGRRAPLLDTIIDETETGSTPGMVGDYYEKVAGHVPDLALIDHLIARAETEEDEAERHRLQAIIVELARFRQSQPDAYFHVYAWLEDKPRLEALFERLTCDIIPGFAETRATRGKARRDRAEEQRMANVETLRPLLASLEDGSAIDELSWAAEHYFGFGGDHKMLPFERVRNACDETSANAAMTGFETLALSPPQVSPRELGIAEGEHRPYPFALSAVAGVHRLLQNAPKLLETAPLTIALAVVGLSGALNMIDGDEAETWAHRRLDQDPEAGAAAILDYWEGRLTKKGAGTSGVWDLAHENTIGPAATIAAERLLERHPDLPHEALTIVLHGVGSRAARETLHRIALAALALETLPERNRAIWNLVLFGIEGASGRDRLAAVPDPLLESLLDDRLGDGLLGIVPPASQAERAERDAVIVRMLGAKSKPGESHPTDGRVLRRMHMSDNVQSALRALEANPDRSVGGLLAEALADDALAPWHDSIRHARAQHLRIVRDASFRPPSAKAVLAALDGKGPVNAMDLKAIVVDELRRLGRELQSGPTNPWRDYWNTDRYGKPVDPKIENVARDITLTKLQERLKPYGIGVALPEGTRAHDTRADVLIMTGAGRNLPVEAKRHYHDDLWTAASTQLRGYAADPGADGHGVLLVFWFGAWRAAPARKDKKKPTNAASLQRLLEADLDLALAATTEVVVFDVSPPGGAPRAKTPRTKAKSEPRSKPLSESAAEAKSKGGGGRRKAGGR